MESGFHRPDLDANVATAKITAGQTAISTSGWRRSLPVLLSGTVTLRELEISDAPSLLAMLTTEEVAQFISPPPTTVEGFEHFINWTHEQRAAGKLIAFGVVPQGMSCAIGLFQVRSLETAFFAAEWGFALGSPFWGSGLFLESARLVLDFGFGKVGIHRMEARASVQNGRGNGALRKLGAVREGVLRSSFLRNGVHHDQILWSILGTDWSQTTMPWGEVASLRIH
jgi:ribosomal-protein-alanine N-acetyltransferase